MIVSRSSDDIYLDTSFVVNSVFSRELGTNAFDAVTTHLIATGKSVYFSELLRLEFSQALRRLATKQEVSRDTAEQFSLEAWHRPTVRHRWLSYGHEQLDEYISLLPEVIEFPLRSELMDMSRYFMGEYSLSSLDAVHLATALHFDIPEFWTCDDHFRRVQDVHVEIIGDTPPS